ncbi:hypothetical protein chiPu_0014993 [Chiloscyllium punctatum]|uniref:Uncharacterized protein n=1 Tax=Chiloscyllium punctatum TaxID=137246 RepID=A0A401T1H6_CHIPU|nr:hypothetical protein [Chiloscyllium punctatum]
MDRRWEARPPRTLPPVPRWRFEMFHIFKIVKEIEKVDRVHLFPFVKSSNVVINKTRKKKSSASNGVDTLVTSTGRRHSESIEPLTPDLQDTAPKKKKKKKKLSAATELETSFTQQSASDVCNFYTGPDDEVSRKIKKRAKRTRPAGYRNELEVEEEDIISEGQVPRPQGPIFAISAGSSQPVDKVFLERSLYFIALVLSLSQQMPSDRLNRHRFTKGSNFTLWPSGSEFQILHPWVVVNLVVSILVGLAWIFLSYHPTLDYTEESEFASHMNDIGAPDEKIKAQA